MFKNILKIGNVLLLMLSVTSLVACETFDLKEYKLEAKNELDTYLEGKSKENLGNWETIIEDASNSKQAIDDATTKSSVDVAVAKAKDAIDEKIENIVLQVKQTYVEMFLKEEHPEATITDVKVTRYLGTYNGSFVAVLNDKFHKVFTEYVITYEYEGFNFSYSNGYPISVWNNGKFYDISHAFKQELLTREDLQTIASLYISKIESEMVTKVKQSYLDTFIKEKWPDATIDDVLMKEYLGTYNGYFVGVFYKRNSRFIDFLHTCEIDGLDFSYSEGYPILVWKNDKFYELTKVYIEGEISRNDLDTIYYLYSNKFYQ